MIAAQSVTFVNIFIRMNVRIYPYQQNYTNEYPNIFILIFLTQTNVRIGTDGLGQQLGIRFFYFFVIFFISQ